MSESYTSLHYHIVFSTKNRSEEIKPPIRDQLFKYIGGTTEKLGGKGVIVGGMPDHIHMLAGVPASISLSNFVRKIKAGSSKWIREKFSGKSNFCWQQGYSAFTVSRSNIEKVRRYIDDQQEHHAKYSFEDELRKLLMRHGIECPAVLCR